MTWNCQLKYKALKRAVDVFLKTFDEAKGKPGNLRLMDKLTASVIRLERARAQMNKWNRLRRTRLV